VGRAPIGRDREVFVLSRFLLVFGLGMVCVLLALIAIGGYWTYALAGLGVFAVVIIAWALIRGTGSRRISDPDLTDTDLERARTAQYQVRDKSRPPGV
jgi:membrane protein implicated in regulation of membrane protease activity